MHKYRMPITPTQLQDCIHQAGFPIDTRPQVVEIVTQGVQNFRDYKTRSYYGSRGKSINKPTAAHTPPAGRHNQKGARTLLISALCRAWITGFQQRPTLNNKKESDSPFFSFAVQVMALEGIGKIHVHLEAYWTERKKTWVGNDAFVKNGDFPGGVF